MLYIVFHIGAERYALESRSVVEVVPRVPLRALPKTPEYVLGILTYRGALAPVLDLCRLIGGNFARSWMSSRMMMVNYRPASGGEFLLGLVAEMITDTFDARQQAPVSAGIAAPQAPYLGPLLPEATGMIQIVRVDELLPEAVRALLFPPTEVAS